MRFRQWETFAGRIAETMDDATREHTRRAFEAMGRALARRCSAAIRARSR